jgi:hypothetical protein
MREFLGVSAAIITASLLSFAFIGCEEKRDVPVTGVSLDITDTQEVVIDGEPLKLKGIVVPGKATNKGLTWSATEDSVTLSPDTSQSGEEISVIGKKAGKSTITVTTDDGSFTDTVEVKVLPENSTIAVRSVSFPNSNYSLVVNERLPITAVITPNNATNRNVIWEVTPDNVVSYETDGLTITLTALDGGTATLKVKTQDGNKEKSAAINVIMKINDGSDNIHIDQFGYRIGDDKVAVIADPQLGFNNTKHFTPGQTYQVREASDNTVVFTGTSKLWNNGQTDLHSGDKVWWFDFSSVGTPGTYYVYDLEKNVKSHNFEIGDDIYEKVLYHALRFFYYQREGIAHVAPFAEAPWTDSAAWLGPGQDTQARDIFDQGNASKARDVSGGWMDAGDTNKYVTFVNSCMHDLLSTYESNPAFFETFKLNIPESHLDAPDILSEAKWEMDWLIKMQNDNGSAHIKAGVKDYSNVTYPPSTRTNPRYYNGKESSAAAIAIASVFAHGALVYKNIPYYSSYGDDLAERAERSWKWYKQQLDNNTRNAKVDNHEITSGNADRTLEQQDIMAIAASAFLFGLTGKAEYHDYFKSNYQKVPPFKGEPALVDHEFRDTGHAFLYYMSLSNADAGVVSNLKDKYAQANAWNYPYKFETNKSAYRAVAGDGAYWWGSQSARAVGGYASYILSDLNLSPSNSANYKKNAANQLHYLNGVNPLGVTYATNMISAGASKSIMHLYHEWFMTGRAPGMSAAPPGYITGGPNTTGNPHSPPDGQPRMKSYWDAPSYEGGYEGKDPWAWTEPMCHYQSPYVRLLACFVGKSSGSAPANAGD